MCDSELLSPIVLIVMELYPDTIHKTVYVNLHIMEDWTIGLGGGLHSANSPLVLKVIQIAAVSLGKNPSKNVLSDPFPCPGNYVYVTLILMRDRLMEQSAETDLGVTSTSGNATVTVRQNNETFH